MSRYVLKCGVREGSWCVLGCEGSVWRLCGWWLRLPVCARSHDTGFLDRTITLQGVTYKYQVFVPDNWTPKQKWPMVLFLHGAGERADDGLQQTDIGIGTAIRNDRSRFAAIVVMPQCRKNLWWIQQPMEDLAIASLEAAAKEFHGDPQRTYLTGLSMGVGTWAWATGTGVRGADCDLWGDSPTRGHAQGCIPNWQN